MIETPVLDGCAWTSLSSQQAIVSFSAQTESRNRGTIYGILIKLTVKNEKAEVEMIMIYGYFRSVVLRCHPVRIHHSRLLRSAHVQLQA